MIRRNLITSAKLQDSAYQVKEKSDIKVRYTVEEAEEIPDDIIQKSYETKNV